MFDFEPAAKASEQPKRTAAEQEPVRETIQDIEAGFEGLSWNAELLTRWLKRYHGIDAGLYELEDETFFIATDSLPENIPDLPDGYGYKGGAARAMLEHALGLPVTTPRDLDLVYVDDSRNENRELSTELAKTYMPEDFAFGYSVEQLEEDYFETRDFTLNEVLYDKQGVVFTKKCLTDCVRNIVRFSEYVKTDSYRGDEFFVSPKLMAKAIRFVADARVKGKEKARLADETEDLQEVYIDSFHMSLHLDRAVQQGVDVAQEYVYDLVERGFLPTDVKTVVNAYDYLINKTDFIFRCASTMEMQRELDFIKEESRYEGYDADTYTTIVPFWMKT